MLKNDIIIFDYIAPQMALCEELIYDEDKLQAALEHDPSIVNVRDDDGMCILHHAAQLGLRLGSSSISKIFDVLFNVDGLNFSIKDNRGETPLHIAVRCCHNRVACQYTFPYLVREAHKRKFDFSTLGYEGLSILHLATQLSYTDPHGIFGRTNNVAQILDIVSDIDVNILSEEGATPLYYAMAALHFDEADKLLDFGANPNLYGNPEYDTIKLVDKYIKQCNETLDDDNIKNIMTRLEKLKIRMLSMVKKPNQNYFSYIYNIMVW